ncbi:hypothetical protein DBA97_22065 [Pseudomonas aeruginosa]|nr:hypothetical protein CD799_13265 [Pseudomonas aeruginosa]AVZ20892.1 hypothetical protein DBA97_22065 [Pseudomonas aeruginosa]ORE45744.1 hypothetical protein B1H15_18150 [Pseudomonas aeruginosa]HBP5738178.1 hypothetical protein [Pseudomonas aeruginosa]
MPQVLGAQYAWRTAVFGEGRPRIALQPGALPHDSKSWRRIAVSCGTRPGDHAPGQPALALRPDRAWAWAINAQDSSHLRK